MDSFFRTLRRALARLVENKDAFVYPVLLIATGIGLVGLLAEIKRDSPSNVDPQFFTFVLITLGMTLAVFMLRFLSGSSSFAPDEDDAPAQSFHKFLRMLDRQGLLVSRRALGPEDRTQLIGEVTSRIKGAASDEFLDEIRTRLRGSEFGFLIKERADETLRRIYKEISALSRRGTLNLVLGVVTAVSGIALLSYVVLGKASPSATIADFAIVFLPRLSIVVIIEVFAYFFLRLYKASLDEIKFFQNEATNIEFHFTALLTALKEEDAALLKDVVHAFIRTERNPILSGDQRTQALEGDRLYASPISLSVQQLGGIIDALGKQGKKDS